MSREIKNKAFREALQREGLQDVLLMKGEGYFYLVGKEGTDMEDNLLRKAETSIFVNSFNQLSIEDWIQEISNLVKE